MTSANDHQLYKLCVMIPEGHVEQVKNAMFDAGAGNYSQYDRCSWETRGTGQFRPLPGSSPFSGTVGEVYQEVTWKVEVICQPADISNIIAAIHRVHPYEVPAFDITPVYINDPTPVPVG